jgi:hypothetical protein
MCLYLLRDVRTLQVASFCFVLLCLVRQDDAGLLCLLQPGRDGADNESENPHVEKDVEEDKRSLSDGCCSVVAVSDGGEGDDGPVHGRLVQQKGVGEIERGLRSRGVQRPAERKKLLTAEREREITDQKRTHVNNKHHLYMSPKMHAQVLIQRMSATTNRAARSHSKLKFQLMVISHSRSRTLMETIRSMRVTRTYLALQRDQKHKDRKKKQFGQTKKQPKL